MTCEKAMSDGGEFQSAVSQREDVRMDKALDTSKLIRSMVLMRYWEWMLLGYWTVTPCPVVDQTRNP